MSRLLNFCQDPVALYTSLQMHSTTDHPTATALRVLEGAIRLYKPSNLAVAFNGGKDATVVLHLTRAVVAKWALDNNALPAVHCLYLLGGGDEFEQVEIFVRQQVNLCALHVTEVDAGFKDGIQLFTKDRNLCAFVMGTRRDDPDGQSIEHFEPSSPGWPPFMRVNPILSWSYHDVWRFLRRFNLPYCPLYDRGYTSLGSVSTTAPNPALKVEHDDGSTAYKPAWMLEDAALERAGRLQKPKQTPQLNSNK